jgi:prepilin-type N-terminal cleavage/methylation domain-containing protein
VKRNQGFTLIEMLISMVLLSMVLLIATSAYSMFSEKWNGRLGYFNRSATNAKHFILVQEILKSIKPYVVTDDKDNAKLYFEGNRNGFVAVSLRSLFQPNKPAVIRLQILQNEDFSYALVYQESVMAEQLLTKVTQQIEFTSPIILFDNLKDVEFTYFAWPSIKSKNWQPDVSFELPEPKAWFGEYNSIEKRVFPEKIKIVFNSEQGEFVLQTTLPNILKGILTSFEKLE